MARMSPPRKKSVGRPKSEAPMKPIASFKGSDEFAAWFDRLADHCRLNASALIEHALVAFAKQREFGEEAPRR